MNQRCDDLLLCLLETIERTLAEIETICPGTSNAYREAIAAHLILQTMPHPMLP